MLYKLARTGLAQKRDPKNEAFTLATKCISMHPTHDGVKKYAQGMITEWNSPSYAARFAESGAVTPAGSQPVSVRGSNPNGRGNASNGTCRSNSSRLGGNVAEKASLKDLRNSRRGSLRASGSEGCVYTVVESKEDA